MKNPGSFSVYRRKIKVSEKLPGLPYLLLIALIAAIAGGAFQPDQRVLLLPAGLISILLLAGIAAKKLRDIRNRDGREIL